MEVMTPDNLPQPTDEDLDFDDPPDWITDPLTRSFWCISPKVRDKCLENRDRLPIFFCFHRGYCTYQAGADQETSKVSTLFKLNKQR